MEACSSPSGSPDGPRRKREVRQCGQECPRTKGSIVSVPFRGFRGLQGLRARVDADLAFTEFQSPSGVLGVCRQASPGGCLSVASVFQSPSGVLGVCRMMDRYPEWVATLGVSVPFRGFRGLQAVCRRNETHLHLEFQSPSGVLGVCRAEASASAEAAEACFGPLPGF